MTQPESQTATPPPTIRRVFGLIGVTLGLLALDQLSKFWAVTVLAGKPPTTYFGIVQLTYAQNHGGWGSLCAQWSDTARNIALQFFRSALLLALTVYAFRYSMAWQKAYGIAVLVSGGVGNLIDRVRFDHVIDFLYVGYGPVGTNIFNIADMAILTGVGLLLYASWKEGDPVEKGKEGEIPALPQDGAPSH